MKKIKELFYSLNLNKYNLIRFFSHITKRNAGIMVGGLMIVFFAGYIFRDKLPFFSSSAGNAPVAYWRFDEGVGSTANDSRATNPGTLGTGNSAPSWMQADQCITGKCLSFDGTNDYIRVADNNSLDFTGSFSFSMWVNERTIGTNTELINKDGVTANRSYTFGLDLNGYPYGYIFKDDVNYTQIRGSTLLQVNRWYHLEYVYRQSADQVDIYVNGIPDKITYIINYAGTVQSTTSPLLIGGREYNPTPEHFPGKIDDIKIYNYARTASQAKADYAARGSTKGVAAQFGSTDSLMKLSSGLVAYWKMDESTGTTTADSSGNGNNSSTFSGNATWISGKYGSAITFDGNDDVVRFPETTSTDLGKSTAPYTVSVWFNTTTDHAGSATIIEKFGNLSSVIPFIIRVDGFNESIQFVILGLSQSASVNTGPNPGYNDGRWHNIVGIRDTLNARILLYIDGNLIGTDTDDTDADISNDDDISIGNGSTGYISDDFQGSIDEVRIYNRVLTSAEITQLYNFAPGPAAFWKMDQKSGTSVPDVSGNNLTGSFGTGDSAPTWTQGKFGNALVFDGTNDYVTVPDSDILTNNTMTWEVWMKPDADISGAVSVLLSKYDNLSGDFRSWTWIYNGNGGSIGLVVSFDGQNNEQSATTGLVSAGVWHHIAATYNSGAISFYIDGKYDSTTNNSQTSLFNNTTPIHIGSAYTGGAHFKGILDDIRIYSYVRTASQIAEDMNAGHPAVGTPVGSTVLNLKMDEGYGTTINDWSPQHNNGTLGTGNSSPTWTNDGKFGKALSFDGSSDYVSAGDINYGTAMSVSMWVKYTSPQAGDDVFISKDNASTNRQFTLFISATDGAVEFFHWNSSDSPTAVAIASPTANQWHHYVGTADSSTICLYIDGKAGKCSAFSGTLKDTAVPLFIGSKQFPGSTFVGSIDEVKMYPFVLTADQVKVEYAGGKSQVLGALSTGLGGTSPSFSSDRSYCVPGDASTCNAPVAEWKLDQKVGSSAPDTSTNGNTATLGTGTSAPSWSKGKVGNALTFDGVSDYVSINDSSSLVFGNGTTDNAFSVSAWVNQGSSTRFSSPTGSAIMTKTAITGGTFEWDFSIYTDQVVMTLYDQTILDSIARVSDIYSFQSNTWYYISATYDGSQTIDGIKIYINGVENDPGTSTGGAYVAMHNTTEPVFIGAFAPQDGSFANFGIGRIDEARIYMYARTPAQIAWEYNKGAPVGWYKFDECTGTTAYNSSPNGNGGFAGNNGTISIGASGTQTSAGTCTSGNSAHAWNNGATGKRNASLNFDGTDDSVTVPDQGYLDISSNFSVEAWVKTTAANDYIATKHDENVTNGWVFAVIGGKGYWDPNSNEGHQPIQTTATVNDGNWHHLVATLNGADQRIYLDGKQSNQRTYSGTLATNSLDLQIGVILANSTLVGYFNGQIDEVKVFNYALTPAQVKTDYAGGAVSYQ